MRPKTTGTAAGIVLGLCVAAGPAGAVTMDVFPSLAPNAFGSPSWAAYAANALDSIENAIGPIGNPAADPTAYEVRGTYSANEIMVSSFNSWKGVVNPGAPFAAELGNRLHFGLHVLGEGTKFRLSNLSFFLDSGDSGNLLDYAGDFTGSSYNATRKGIDYGGDGIKGTADDVVYFGAGPGDALIDELVYVGVGNAFWPQVPGEGATPEEAVANVLAFIRGETPFNIITTYTLVDDNQNVLATGVGTARLVPEPATLAIVLLGIAPLAAARRRTAVRG